MAERGRLRVLQVGLVGHQRAGVLAAPSRELRRELGGRLDQVSQVVAQAQPEGDPDRLPARPAGVQPAGHVADLADEIPLARVVRLAVGRVVGEVGGRDVHGLQQQREQAAGRIGRDHPGRAQVEQVRDVGQVHPPVQHPGVGVLQLEPGGYELGRGRARWRPGRGTVCGGHGAASCAAATASRTPPVCQKTTDPRGGSRHLGQRLGRVDRIEHESLRPHRLLRGGQAVRRGQAVTGAAGVDDGDVGRPRLLVRPEQAQALARERQHLPLRGLRRPAGRAAEQRPRAAEQHVPRDQPGQGAAGSGRHHHGDVLAAEPEPVQLGAEFGGRQRVADRAQAGRAAPRDQVGAAARRGELARRRGQRGIHAVPLRHPGPADGRAPGPGQRQGRAWRAPVR